MGAAISNRKNGEMLEATINHSEDHRQKKACGMSLNMNRCNDTLNTHCDKRAILQHIHTWYISPRLAS